MIYDDLLNRPSVHFQHEYQAERKDRCPPKGSKTWFREMGFIWIYEHFREILVGEILFHLARSHDG